MIALARDEEGFVHRFRSLIRQRVHIFEHVHRQAQAKLTLHQRRQASNAMDDAHLQQMLTCCDDDWEQALRSLRTKGMGQHRRGSNSLRTSCGTFFPIRPHASRTKAALGSMLSRMRPPRQPWPT